MYSRLLYLFAALLTSVEGDSSRSNLTLNLGSTEYTHGRQNCVIYASPCHWLARSIYCPSNRSAFKGQDAVISTIATASAGQQTHLIDLAIKAGVKQFISSEFGSDTRHPNTMAILSQYFGGKRATVDYLIGKEKDGLKWSSLVTGPFFELHGAMAGFIGFDIPNRKVVIYNDGEGVWSTTTLSSIALAVKNSFLEPEKTANRYIYTASFSVKQNEVLEALENVTGSKFDIEYVDAEAERAIGMERVSKGDFSGAILCNR